MVLIFFNQFIQIRLYDEESDFLVIGEKKGQDFNNMIDINVKLILTETSIICQGLDKLSAIIFKKLKRFIFLRINKF